MLTETVGIVGASGDLGGQLVKAYQKHGSSVTAYSRSLDKLATLQNISKTVSLGDIARCSFIHWCAPLEGLRELSELDSDTILILHDSVMHSSLQAMELVPTHRVAIVHWLMNTTGTVVIAEESTSEIVKVHEHFRELGLRPVVMGLQNHDYIMAHSQAPLALFCKFLMPQLEEYDTLGLLTPSAEALKEVLESRVSHWTPATMDSILGNPELLKLVRALEASITVEQPVI